MFKLIAVRYGGFAIMDTEDGVIDVCDESEVMNFLKVGIEIAGIQPLFEQGTFQYDDSNFVSVEDDEDDDLISDEDYYDSSDFDDDVSSEDTDDFDDDEDSDDDGDDAFDYADDEDDSEGYEQDEDGYFEPLDDDYEDYEDITADTQEESYVNKLYALLTDEQKDVLKRYYLWSSQILFGGAPTSGNLQVTKRAGGNVKKEELLEKMRQGGQDWVYAGFIDMEYHGAEHCTFGHALRFLHFAWDVGYADLDTEFWGSDLGSINWEHINELIYSGHVIKFGIDCIGDFFDVPKENLTKIKNMQVRSLAEMKHMYTIMSDPTRYANAMASFSVFDDMVKIVLREASAQILTHRKVADIDYNLFSFCNEFKKLGMLYPRSLVKAVQDILLKRKTHSYNVAKNLNTEVLIANLKRVQGVNTKNLQAAIEGTDARASIYGGSRGFIRNYVENYFLIQLAGIYAYNPYSKDPRDRDEGMKNKASRAYFNSITGTSDSDEKDIQEVMKTYDSYPMLFNQVNGTGIRYRGTFDDIRFTPEYMGKLNELVALMGTLRVYPRFDDMHICAHEYNTKTGLYDKSDREATGIALKSLWEQIYGSSHMLSFYNYYVGDRCDPPICTIDDLINHLKSLKSTIDAKIGTFEEDINSYYSKYNEEKERKLKAMSDAQERKANRLAAEKAKESQELSELKSTDDEENEENEERVLTPDEAVDAVRKDLRNHVRHPYSMLKKIEPSDSVLKKLYIAGFNYNFLDVIDPDMTQAEMIACVAYAESNFPDSVAVLDNKSAMIRKILGTLKSYGKPASSRQMWYIKTGLKEILKSRDVYLQIVRKYQEELIASTGASDKVTNEGAMESISESMPESKSENVSDTTIPEITTEEALQMPTEKTVVMETRNIDISSGDEVVTGGSHVVSTGGIQGDSIKSQSLKPVESVEPAKPVSNVKRGIIAERIQVRDIDGLAEDARTIRSRFDDVVDAYNNKGSKLFLLSKALDNAINVGYVTESQLKCINDAKKALGL